MKHQFKYSLKDFSDGIEAIMRDPGMRCVSVFCDPLSEVKQRIRVTRRDENSLIVTYGKPNFQERAFLKMCKKAKTSPQRFKFQFFKTK